MKKFIVLLILLLSSRFLDAYTTYVHIPDLSTELNPVVSIFGKGWTGLLVIHNLVLALLIYCLWVYCFKKMDIKPFEKPVSLKQFVSLFYFNNPDSFAKIFYKLPTNKYSLAYSFGGALVKSVITISFIVGTSTTFLILSEQYRQFYRIYKIPVFLMILMVGIVLFQSIQFFKNERLKYS
jgi:hypothetical protein